MHCKNKMSELENTLFVQIVFWGQPRCTPSCLPIWGIFTKLIFNWNFEKHQSWSKPFMTLFNQKWQQFVLSCVKRLTTAKITKQIVQIKSSMAQITFDSVWEKSKYKSIPTGGIKSQELIQSKRFCCVA